MSQTSTLGLPVREGSGLELLGVWGALFRASGT